MKNWLNQIMDATPRGLMDVFAVLVAIGFVCCVARYLYLKSRESA